MPKEEGVSMLRVLIADDEERICQLILTLGEWKRLALEVVGVAHNGQEALELVKTLSPDILITDIRMPGLSGLDVISQAKALTPALEVVVISGYAQFDYAQTAIRNGVGEYLLKPINREALNHTLAKMARAIGERKQRADDLETILVASQDDREKLRHKLISDLWLNGEAPESREALKRVYHFSDAGEAFQVFILKVDGDLGDHQESFLKIIFQKADDLLLPVLQKTCEDAVLSPFYNRLVGVVGLRQNAAADLRSQLRGVLNQLVAQKSLFGAVAFTVALGDVCLEPSQLSASLKSAGEAEAERLIEGTGKLLEGAYPASGALQNDYQARYAQKASHAIDVLSVEEADEAVDALKSAADYPNLRGWEMLEMARNAGRLFITRLCPGSAVEAMKTFDDELSSCGSVSALWDKLRKAQTILLNQTMAKRRDLDTQPIRNAKLYIHKHFAEPITLEEVSAATGFSVNYFSTLFKKENGEGFTKYLTKVRMDEARSLLRDTNASVADICGRVGYSDVKHFTKTFKAETGLTPGEYRKLYG